MGKCIIKYKGQKYSEEQFKEYFVNNKQEFATSIAKNKDVADSFKAPTANILFNLNKQDNSRKAVNNRLNILLSKTLNKIKVETIDENGVISIKPIRIKTIKEYKKWHSNKYDGQVIDALGIANMVDGIVAYSTEDGITLPEEALHLIVELIINTPEVQEILTKKDSNGVRLLETTKVYNDNVKEYTERYNDSSLVDKEILGKLIAQYMYDSRKVESFRNKVLRLLQRALKKLFINIKLAYELNPKEYPIEFRQALGIIDNNISADKYISDKNNVIVRNPNSLGVITANPAANLIKVEKSLKEIIKRYDQLLQESKNKGADWDEYKHLFNVLSMAMNAEDGVHNLTAKRISELKAKILIELQKDPSNLTLSNQFININKLEKHFNTFEKSKSDTTLLYSLEYRLAKVRKYYETKSYEEGLNIFLFGTGNVEGKEYTDFNYNEHGAIYDMFKASSKVKELLATPELIRTDHIAQITEILATYVPIIEVVEQTYIDSGNKLFENDDVRNVKVGEALQLINEYIKEAYDFINSNNAHYNAQRNAYLDELSNTNVQSVNKAVFDLVDKNSPKEYTELSQFKKVVGLYKNAQEGWLRLFTKKLKTVMNAVKQRNYSDAINIYTQLTSLGYYDLSASQIVKTFYQLDSKGKPTGYINTERDVAGWVKSREEYKNSIPKLLRQIANASTDPYMKSLNIPTDYYELMQKFVPIYALEKEDRKNLTPEMQALWKLRDAYSTLWSEWEEVNTEQFQEDDVKRITEERRQQLSKYHFNKWYSENIRTYTRFDGSEVTYYTGELRRPKKINENWHKLSTNQKKMALVYAEELRKAKLSALPDKYNFEWFARAPQITKTMFDSVTGGSRYATFKERLKGVFSERVDDDFYNVDKEGQIIKIPPLRYNKKLPDPELLTNDVLRALITYKNSINHRNIFLSAMPELQGMIDMVDTSIVNTQETYFSKSSTKEGRSSHLKAAMDHLMETIVFGNTENKMFGSERITSFFRSGKSYVTSLNLAYNSAAMITSWISSEVDTFVNANIGDLFDKPEYKKGKKEFLGNMYTILKDFENPIKTTKLGALAVVMEVGNTITDNMSKTNVSRGSRMIVGATKPFSGWNAGEIMLSLPIIATMGMSIKNIDGVWMTKQQANKNKVDKKLWNSSTSIYDILEVKNGVIDFKDVPQNIIDLYFIKTQNAISQMSQSLSATDKGTMYKNTLFSFLGVHMSWLILQLDKMFGAEIYNYESEQNEAGYYNRNSLKYTFEVGAAAIKDTIRSMMNMKLNFEEFNNLMDVSINPYNEAKIRNTKRIGVQMAVITAFSLLAYMLVGLALDDEDDEQLSPLLQLAALTALKVRIEQGAKLSLKDMHEFAQKPLSTYDASFSRFQFVNSAIDMLAGEDEEYKKDNIYTGMSKLTVNTIRSIPYLKGIFESYLGWYLNSNLSGDISEQARAMKSKREGVINFVVQPKGQGSDLAVKTAFDALSLPAYIIGNTGGKNILQILDSNHSDNEGLFNSKLPSKKAQNNKDE